ncbi:MAG: spermidine synthase, partial [Bellilinea sp.]
PGDIRRMAIVGLAAGTTARQAGSVFPNLTIDGIEIDPEIVEVGRQYFGMDLPYLNVIIQDGRWGLAHSRQKYQVISVDAYRPPYIPWHMTTLEFFQLVRDRLTDDGVMVINVGRSPSDRRLINTLYTTIAQVFPSVHIMDLPDSFNSILFATVQPTHAENLTANFQQLSQSPATSFLLLQAMAVTIQNLQPAPPPGVVFSDDRSPIEWITNEMILDFLFSGEVETLQ